MNSTFEKFEYARTKIKEYKYWAVLLRLEQPTLGSVILINKGEECAFSELPTDAFSELEIAIKEIESTLKKCFDYQKINYLMLMMVDPHVHFHVIPRYENDQEFKGVMFADKGWPQKPDLDGIQLPESSFEELRNHIQLNWASK